MKEALCSVRVVSPGDPRTMADQLQRHETALLSQLAYAGRFFRLLEFTLGVGVALRKQRPRQPTSFTNHNRSACQMFCHRPKQLQAPLIRYNAQR